MTSLTGFRVLLIDDDGALARMLSEYLSGYGLAVDWAIDAERGLEKLGSGPRPDVVVLDVMLPGLDGVSICKSIRAGGPNSDAAVLMVTARDGETDKVLGLESGADDYIAKPFGIRELMARVTAVTRRHKRASTAASDDQVAASRGPLVIDDEKRTVSVRGDPVELTKQEFDLLHRLVARPGMVFSRATLLESVWKDDLYVTERTVDSVISRLRKKIEVDPRDPELILTAWGVGYKFADIDPGE